MLKEAQLAGTHRLYGALHVLLRPHGFHWMGRLSLPSAAHSRAARLRLPPGVWLLLLGALVASAGSLLQIACAGALQAATGLRAQVAAVQVRPLHGDVQMYGVHLLNPEGFSEPVMVEISELYAKYRLRTFFTEGVVHLERLQLVLHQLHVVRSPDGRLNLEAIRGWKPFALPWDPRTSRLDALDLHIGTVTLADHTKQPPLARRFHVDSDQRYPRITYPTLLPGFIVSQALLSTMAGQLMGLDVEGLRATTAEGLRYSPGALGGLLKGGVRRAGEIGWFAVETTGDAVRRLADVLSRVVGTNRHSEADPALKK